MTVTYCYLKEENYKVLKFEVLTSLHLLAQSLQ